MKKFLLSCFLALGIGANAQIAYSENWDTGTGLNSWTTSGSVFSRNTTAAQTCGGTGGTIRGERYYGNSGQLTSPALTGNNLGPVTMSFDYKITDYSLGTTGTVLSKIGTIKVEYASSTSGPWTTAYTIDATNHTVANTCATKTVTFGPSSGSLYVRFNVTSSSSGDSYYYFDNVSISQGAAPTCFAPSSVVTSGVTTNSADISWTAPTTAPASGYDVYYSTSNTAPTTSSTFTNIPSGTSTTLSSLASATVYYVWVRSNCATSDQSSWVGPLSFTTLCDTISSLPWSENFDSMTTIGGGIVPSCWKNVTGTKAWTSMNASTTNHNLPKSAPNYMSIAFSNTTASQLWTPGFALTAGTSYDFSFYYNTNGTSSSYIGFTGDVQVNTSPSLTGASSLGTFITATQGTTAYTLYKVSYTPTTTGTYYFAVNVSSTSAPWYLGIDDFSMKTTPGCVSPSAVTASNITATSATLSWSAPSNAPANGYEIYYSSTNAAPTSATTPSATGITETSYSVSGLTAATTYYAWVRSNCSDAEKGEWSAVSTFTTACVILEVPYIQDFNSSTSLPVCTTTQNLGSGSSWIVYPADAYFPSNILFCNYDATYASNAWFYTPGINLKANKTYLISYKYGGGFDDGTTVYIDKLKVAYGTSATNTAMTNPINDHSDIRVNTALASASKSFSPPADGVYYFGFNAYSAADQNFVGIDDISIKEDATLATSDLSKSAISVYPNPFTDVLKISDVRGVKSISVNDMTGREVKSTAPSAELNLSNLKTGLYIVNLKMEDGSVKSFKAIKK